MLCTRKCGCPSWLNYIKFTEIAGQGIISNPEGLAELGLYSMINDYSLKVLGNSREIISQEQKPIEFFGGYDTHW